MKKRRRPQNAFSQASRNLSVRCVITSFKPRAGTRFPVGPVPGYRTRRKAHALPIVRDEFRPAIPRRVARQHCPPPLLRHHQIKTIAALNGILYHRTVASLLTVRLSAGDKPSWTSPTPLVPSTSGARSGTWITGFVVRVIRFQSFDKLKGTTVFISST